MKKITANAQGHNGIINFEIDVVDNTIDDFKITDHSETAGIFNQVIEQLKDNILTEQSFDVDAISGATVMTEAILASAKNAMIDSNVKIESIKTAQRHKIIRLTTDVAIIGGGEAGLVAGAKSLVQGNRVLLLEKNGYLGGATILNGSNVVATGSKVADEIFGVNTDTTAQLAADVTRESKGTNYLKLTKLMTNNIGPAIDFVSNFADLHYQKAQTQTPEHSISRQVELPSASSYEFIEKLSKTFINRGGEVKLGARVEKIKRDNQGNIVGIIAETKNETLDINCHSIVLATGGYGANEKMRGNESKGIDYYGPTTSTGDAYDFTRELNLDTHNLDWYKIYPHGVEVEPGIAKLTTYASKKATDMGGIYVNNEGHRIINESDVYTTFRDAILQQPGKVAYLVMDKRTWKEFYALLVQHDFSENEVANFFEDTNVRPIFAKGTLIEVAKIAGIDYKELKKTISEYQDYTKTGIDIDFNRPSEFLHEFEGDEYYVVEQRGRYATTLGGFNINDRNMLLVNKDKVDVENLFGAGEVIGGANGHDSMPSMMNTWAISSGYVAGTQAGINAMAKRKNNPNLLAIVGTNAGLSYNRKLLHFMKETFSLQANIEIVEIKGIPLFNEDDIDNAPQCITELANKIKQADGIIFGVPEYDHAIPSSLKSVLEWLSSVEHPFENKPVMIVGASYGVQGSVRAQINLRQILDAPGVNAQIMPGNEFMLSNVREKFDENNNLIDSPSISFLTECFNSFLSFIKIVNLDLLIEN